MGKCYFNQDWLNDDRFVECVGREPNNPDTFFCRVCKQTCLIGQSGVKALTSHMKSGKHNKNFQAAKQSKSMFSFVSNSTRATLGPASSTASTTVPQSTFSTPSTNPVSAVRTLDAHISNDKVLSAEVRWVLHLVTSHCSARSSDDVSALFRSMFPDSGIAKRFQCARTKAGYMTTFGLAPAIRTELLKEVKNSDLYVLLFDESFNDEIQMKQMDKHIRYIADGLVTTRYLHSYFMGHAKAADLMKNIMDAISLCGNQNLLQLSMDGPNVNWRVFKDLTSELNKDHLRLPLNLGSCGLHIFHNAFKDGVKATGWDISSLLRAVYYLFHESPARREDFFNTSTTKSLPLPFCGHRWLENLDAAERCLTILPAVKKYVSACRSGKCEPLCKSYKVVADMVLEKLMAVKLKGFIFVAKILQPFLAKYQSNDPLVPYLASDIFSIVKRLFALVLKDDALSALTMEGTLDPGKLDKDLFKDKNSISLGYSADSDIKSLHHAKTVSERDILGIRIDFHRFVVAVISKIVDKSPLAFKLARDISCLDPGNFKKADAQTKFKALIQHLNKTRWISDDDVDSAEYSFSRLRDYPLPENLDGRLDRIINDLPLKDCPCLKRIFDISLVLSHGQAEVERGFSTNKEVTVENMKEESLIAKRLVCQYVQLHGGSPADMALTKALLSSCSGAYQSYKAALDARRQESEKEARSNKRKGKSEELGEMNAKKRKIERGIDLLIRRADDMVDDAEKHGSSATAHELVVQSNALRKEAKAKKSGLQELTASIQALEGELATL